jgi:hypothetical protein
MKEVDIVAARQSVSDIGAGFMRRVGAVVTCPGKPDDGFYPLNYIPIQSIVAQPGVRLGITCK